jgi:hypothetical protein
VVRLREHFDIVVIGGAIGVVLATMGMLIDIMVI